MRIAWKRIHRWVALLTAVFVSVLGLSGAFLAFDPLQQAWQAFTPTADPDVSVAVLAERVSRQVDGVEEIRRLPSGVFVVHSFDGEHALASRIDPTDGSIQGAYQPSASPRWVKNLHRSLLLGDAGRWGVAGVAFGTLLLSISGLVLLLRRMGGWRHAGGAVRGTLSQRVHVISGRIILVVLLVSSLAALCLSAGTLGFIVSDGESEVDVLSTPLGQVDASIGQLQVLQTIRLRDLRSLRFPVAEDPEDTWTVTTRAGEGRMDRYSGELLAWREATLTERLQDWARMLHTGEGAWPWALALGLMGMSLPLFSVSGVAVWWQRRRERPCIRNNSSS